MDKNLKINRCTDCRKHGKATAAAGVEIARAKSEDLPYIKEKIEKYWLDGRGISVEQFFVARNKDCRLVGFIRYVEHPDFYEPATLGVDYYWRGKGIGTMLFGHIMSVIKRDKPAYILTHIPEFFKKYNFEHTDNYPPEIEQKIKTACKLSKDKLFVMCCKERKTF